MGLEVVAPVRLLHTLTAVLLLIGAATALAAERPPLLMEGKKTLYERVLTRPGAQLFPGPGETGGRQQPAFTRYYVYGRAQLNDYSWLEVGATSKGRVDGWLREDSAVPWKQQLALAFTNPAGRNRTLMFAERKDLMAILEADDPASAVAPLQKVMSSGGKDARIVSMEPDTHVDIAKKFYLLPILEAEEIMAGTGHYVRALEVASVSAQDSVATGPDPKARVSLLKNFRAAVVFVIDTTISMGPYIDRTREVVRRVYSEIKSAGLDDRVRFGLVAFRSSIEATPALEYVSRVYADPVEVRDGDAFLKLAAAAKPATVSSARFSEDAFAGVMTALNQTDWTKFGGRYLVLVTDAGALGGSDPLSATGLDAEQVRLEAQHRGVAVYSLHLQTPSGKDNHAVAEAQYKTLSSHPLVPSPLYYPVEAGSVERFGEMVDALGKAIVEQVNAAYRGEAAVGSARTADDSFTRPAPPDEKSRLRSDAAMLGHAMVLQYLGSMEGAAAPPLFKAWICDRDLARPDVPTTEVRVLVTKNQLSDMQQVLRSILKAAQAAQLAPDDFFNQMRSAAVVMGRDPAAINNPNATRLADLGLMGEYLDGLPYRSKILSIDQDLWSSWSIGQQQQFIDEIERKLRLYQIYHDDVDRWVALDGGSDPGEMVYPVVLEALP